jgi:hypothetical protein
LKHFHRRMYPLRTQYGITACLYLLKSYSCPTTRHGGTWGRGGIAPTHSRPRH